MGNIITLLGLGKKVYMRNDITSWDMFKDSSIDVFDLENFNLDTLEGEVKNKNMKKIKEYYSKENLKKQLGKIFDE